MEMEEVVALIGIDWADESHEVYVYDIHSNRVENETVEQKAESLYILVKAAGHSGESGHPGNDRRRIFVIVT